MAGKERILMLILEAFLKSKNPTLLRLAYRSSTYQEVGTKIDEVKDIIANHDLLRISREAWESAWRMLQEIVDLGWPMRQSELAREISSCRWVLKRNSWRNRPRRRR
ncbi:MAG: hypothetical protein V1897_15555 [Pseudomonadota bacterium]